MAFTALTTTSFLGSLLVQSFPVFAIILILVLLVLSFAPVVYEWYRPNTDIFAPIVWAAPLFSALYAIPAAQRIWYHDYSFTGRYLGTSPLTTLTTVTASAIFGLITLTFGYYLVHGRRLASRLPPISSEWSTRRAWIAITVLTGVGLAGYLSLPEVSGSRAQLAQGSSMVSFIAVNLLNTASTLILAEIALNHVSYRDYVLSLSSPLMIVFGLGVVATNARLLWTLGGRHRAFVVGIIGLFLVHYLLVRLRPALGFTAYLAVTFFPAWIANLAANALTLNTSELFKVLLNPYLLRAVPTSPFNNTMLVFAGVPHHLDFQYGATFLSALFAVLPMQPVPETQAVVNPVFFPNVGNYGFSISLLSELYLNFWYPGIILGFLLVGIIMRTVYEWAIIQYQTVGSVVLFATIANNYLLTGNFSNSFPQFGLKLLPALIAVFYISTADKSLRNIMTPNDATS